MATPPEPRAYKGCVISSLIGSLEPWREFVLKKLGFNNEMFEEIQEKEEEFLLDSRVELIEIWKKLGGNIPELRRLVKEFKDGEPESERDGDLPQLGTQKERRKRGCALIISNSFKENEEHRREGAAEKDKKLMVDLWAKTLGCDLFDGTPHMNKTAEDMKRLLKDMASLDARKKGYDYVVVVISTHGGLTTEREVTRREAQGEKEKNKEQELENAEGINVAHIDEKQKQKKMQTETVEVFYGEDEMPVRESEIIKYFHNDQALGLHDIKKFFILDYCRGRESSSGVDRKAGGFNNDEEGSDGDIPKDDVLAKGVDKDIPAIPVVSDVLVTYATHPSFVSYDDKNQGSWLISAIAKTFKREFKKQHAVSMLTMVNKEIKDKVGYKKPNIRRKAMSVFQSSLVEELWF